MAASVHGYSVREAAARDAEKAAMTAPIERLTIVIGGRMK